VGVNKAYGRQPVALPTCAPEVVRVVAIKVRSAWSQSLHFDGRPSTSDLTSTPDMPLHRANRREGPEGDMLTTKVALSGISNCSGFLGAGMIEPWPHT